MSTKTETIFVNIYGEDIVTFNKTSGSTDDWGSYENPFDATQFMTIGLDGSEEPSATNIPTLYPELTYQFVINFVNDNPILDFQIDHIRLRLIGEEKFATKTPRDAWKEIFDLDATDGAIGFAGDFFLGQKDGPLSYEVVTSSLLSDDSNNLGYGIRFAIKIGSTIKYCQIDPLIRTSSQN